MRTFEDVVKDRDFSDEMVETLFYFLDPQEMAKGIDTLKKHRLELAKKIARAILREATRQLQEEATPAPPT